MRSPTASQRRFLQFVLAIVISLALLAQARDAGGQSPTDVQSPTDGGADDGRREGEAASAPSDKEAAGWSFTLGLGASLAPAYEGGEDLQLSDYPEPLVDIRWRSSTPWKSALFAGTLSGVGIMIADTGAFSFGLSGFYGGGRSEGDGDRLDGLGDINDSVFITMLTEYEYEIFSASIDVTRFLGGSDGTLITFLLGAGLPLTEQFEVGAGVGTTFGDGRYMGQFFSVTDGQARRSKENLGAFDADAGFKSVDFGLEANYAFFDGWTFTSSAGMGLLVGDAADSPIVEQAIQPFFSIGLTYRF